MKAFAIFAIGKITRQRVGKVTRQTIAPAALLDEDDDLAVLLKRGRKLPGRTVTVRTADNVQIAHRLTAPGGVASVPDETTAASEREDVEDIRVAG